MKVEDVETGGLELSFT